MGQSGEPFERDLSRFPVALWRVLRPLTVAEMQALMDDMTIVLRKRSPYVQVMSAAALRGKSALPPGGRALQVQWSKDHFDELSRHCLGMAIVAEASPVLHFAASMVMSVMGKSPSPWKMFGSEDAAFAWAHTRLAGVNELGRAR